MDLNQRMERLEQLLDRGPALLLLEQTGAVLRRWTRLTESQREQLDALCRRASAAAELMEQAVAGIETHELEQSLRELDALSEAPLDWLERRERLEQLRLGARRICGPGAVEQLERELSRIDELGRDRVAAFLHRNTTRRARQAELDPDPAGQPCWWWSLRSECDLDGLAGLASEPRLLEHLQRCRFCQQDLEQLRRLDRMLGPVDEEHPTSADLVAHADGAGTAQQREAVALHLAGCKLCQGLVVAAAAGLDESRQVEAGLALLAGRDREPQADGPAPWIHLPLNIGPVVSPRALAAEPALQDDLSLPDQRQVLIEAEDLRLVFWSDGSHGWIGLFVEASIVLARLSVTLEGQPQTVVDESGARLCDLGPLSRLPGLQLELELELRGTLWRRSWTLVPEV